MIKVVTRRQARYRWAQTCFPCSISAPHKHIMKWSTSFKIRSVLKLPSWMKPLSPILGTAPWRACGITGQHSLMLLESQWCAPGSCRKWFPSIFSVAWKEWPKKTVSTFEPPNSCSPPPRAAVGGKEARWHGSGGPQSPVQRLAGTPLSNRDLLLPRLCSWYPE